jgi:hypothetical protein
VDRRSLLVAAGWLGAVVLAVLVGLGAISVIGSRLTSPDARPKSEADVARDLAAMPSQPGAASGIAGRPGSSASDEPPGLPAAPAVTAPPATPPGTETTRPATTSPTSGRTGTTRPAAPPAAAASRTFTTGGGTVVATCSSRGATITSMSPASGYAVHEKSSGALPEAEGEFRSTSDNHDRVKFAVTCSGGRPALRLRDSGGSGSDD